MSLILEKLCKSIILEHCGPVVQEIGSDLFKHGSRTIGQIRQTTKLPIKQIKESICVLIYFGFVTFEEIDQITTYSINTEKILLVLKYPRYMKFVKTFCGDDAEIILEEVLKHRHITASQAIVRTCKRLELFPPERRSTIPVLKEKFELLVKNQFLMRSLIPEISVDVPTEASDFSIPSLNIKTLIELFQGYKADPGDNDIFWKINIDRFTQDLRDQILVNAIKKRIDENAAELMRQLLFLMYLRTASWADRSIPIPVTEIREAMKANFPSILPSLEQYLRIIEEDSCQFIQRVGDSGGGQYVVNMKEAFLQLAWSVLENLVTEKYGSKAARIFRLVKSHKYIEQEKIQQLAMIPAKEAKHLTYTLLEGNFLQIQELKKATVASAPTKVFFTFHIDLNQAVRMAIEHCYFGLYNVRERRKHEQITNQRLIDKELRVQSLATNFRENGASEEDIADISGMMSLSERQDLEKVHERIKNLGMNEFCVEETLFKLEMYIKYHR